MKELTAAGNWRLYDADGLRDAFEWIVKGEDDTLEGMDSDAMVKKVRGYLMYRVPVFAFDDEFTLVMDEEDAYEMVKITWQKGWFH